MDNVATVFTDFNGCDFTAANLTSTSLVEALPLGGANFQSATLTGVNFSGQNLSAVNLTGALCGNAIFTGCTMPANADTKAKFKALVGYWNAATTIWIDGNPIG
jgi:uncharacterized protein YjbI with pentapeptide repeats